MARGATVKVEEKDGGGLRAWVHLKGLSKHLTFTDIGIIDTDDPEIAKRARAHEFGNERVPERSFLRSTVKKNGEKYAQLAAKISKKIVDGESAERAMQYLGDVIAADVKETLIRGVSPPLKDATVKQKKRAGYARPATPVYATGETYEAIGRRVGVKS